jgi:hypothetical protein
VGYRVTKTLLIFVFGVTDITRPAWHKSTQQWKF